MFEKRQLRVAAALLYGGTYGILLGGVRFNLVWAGRTGLSEPDQVWILTLHLMAGMASGVVFGLIFGWKPRKLAAWVGSLLMGVVGVYVSRPVVMALTRDPVLADRASIAIIEAFPYLGMWLGPKVGEWLAEKESG
ncbi:MAG: hypothetical protein HZC36_12530 [Armatimonadetes bacterium]|nr:hypothetical protein [Armatimonadota bacterium]